MKTWIEILFFFFLRSDEQFLVLLKDNFFSFKNERS